MLVPRGLLSSGCTKVPSPRRSYRLFRPFVVHQKIPSYVPSFVTPDSVESPGCFANGWSCCSGRPDRFPNDVPGLPIPAEASTGGCVEPSFVPPFAVVLSPSWQSIESFLVLLWESYSHRSRRNSPCGPLFCESDRSFPIPNQNLRVLWEECGVPPKRRSSFWCLWC